MSVARQVTGRCKNGKNVCGLGSAARFRPPPFYPRRRVRSSVGLICSAHCCRRSPKRRPSAESAPGKRGEPMPPDAVIPRRAMFPHSRLRTKYAARLFAPLSRAAPNKKSAGCPLRAACGFYTVQKYYDQTTPCASIASATFTKPAMFAPATRLSFMPYFSAALAALW